MEWELEKKKQKNKKRADETREQEENNYKLLNQERILKGSGRGTGSDTGLRSAGGSERFQRSWGCLRGSPWRAEVSVFSSLPYRVYPYSRLSEPSPVIRSVGAEKVISKAKRNKYPTMLWLWSDPTQRVDWARSQLFVRL